MTLAQKLEAVRRDTAAANRLGPGSRQSVVVTYPDHEQVYEYDCGELVRRHGGETCGEIVHRGFAPQPESCEWDWLAPMAAR